ncbi:SCO family protein [Salipaludibacillus keqinensis]|uniref:SCO family protein n=1 Tax=Salipaludibacillus keqinensis TaxID=2045207 RepID=A0A323TBP4_9BACI|nr:SCO family protein [Salipaludibacillus keqinensis]PYZ92290.1 SCO family protein [Salipaludibacillus keqinensis]
MIKKQHTAIACFIVIVFGLVLLYTGTDGFTAYTAETARVNQLVNEQPEFPDVTFTDSQERTYSIAEFEDKYIFITFIYTSCGDECPLLEMNMGMVYDQIPENYLGEDIIFLSISFDPERDDPETLDVYKDMFHADGETWRMATITEQSELDALLEEFGVIVIPDGKGKFAHNSAFYLVDRQGHLKDIMDFTDVDSATQRVMTLLEAKEGE